MAEGKRQKAEGVPEGWREVRLGDVTSIYDGTHQTPKYVDEGVPFYSVEHVTGNQFQNTKFISEEVFAKETIRIERGDILMSRIGDVGTARMVDWDVRASFYVSLALIKKSSDFDSKFLESFINSSFFKSELWHRTIHTAFPLKINLGEIGKCRILLPPLPEQRKIAAILSTWDDSIATLTNLLAAKRQQKRGLAEALLTGKKRLPGFEGEWETVRLGDVFTRMTRKNTEGNERALTISGTLGLIDQREFFNKRVAAADLSGYYLLRRGEFAYNKSYSAGYDFGAIKRLNRYESGVVSTLYICFALSQADAVSDFYEQFFEAGLLNEGISGIAQEGARNHGLLNVSAKDFFELPITVPDPKEQQAIASILSTLDGEIASLEALKAKVQEQKRGLMDELLTGRVRVKVEG